MTLILQPINPLVLNFISCLFQNMWSLYVLQKFFTVGVGSYRVERLKRARKPGRQDGGVGGNGCEAPKDEPRPPARVTKGALPRKRRKADPSGVRQARHPDQTPDGNLVLPAMGSPTGRTPCSIPVDPAGGHCYGGPTKPCESWGALCAHRRTAQ